MAKKKHNPEDQQSVPTSPPKKRSGIPIHAWIAENLGEAFDRYLDSLEPKPTATAAISLALKEFLTKRGFWPPGTSADSDA